MRRRVCADLLLTVPRDPLRVLFLCTGNSARSIMAQALLRQLGGARFQASSAGSAPTGQVHPRALAALEDAAVPAWGLYSKGMDNVAAARGDTGAAVDLVITLCDGAAEACPVLQGAPAVAHWGLADPAAAPAAEARSAFAGTLSALRRRLERLVALPEAVDRDGLQRLARDIHDSAQAAERGSRDG